MPIKHFVPPTLKRPPKGAWHRFLFRYTVRSLLRGNAPTNQVLARLSRTWGNEGWSGDVSYLREVCRLAAATESAILECGSGLTTILLGIFATLRGVRVFSLEHMPEWQSRVNQTLRSLGLPNRVALAELRSYGEFDWYDPPTDLPSGIGLVICDGPPSITPGGRYGLLPVCMEHFAPNCTILLDDAERDDERAIIHNWQSRFNLSVEVDQGVHGAFARCTYRGGGLQEIPAVRSMAATAGDGTSTNETPSSLQSLHRG